MRRILLFVFIAYFFLLGFFSREIGGLPYSNLIDVLLIFLWGAVVIKTPKEDYKLVANDLVYLFSFWFIVSLLEGFNPGSSTIGWASEIRSTALYPFLLIPLVFLIFRNNKHLDVFLILIIVLSTLAGLNGIKQLYFGPSRGEQMFLDEGGYVTHILFGQLRVFSFYSDAGQFGASQAHLGLVSVILATGPFKTWKRLLFLVAGCVMLYGMLISGTRGALFALIVGAFFAIVLSKNFKFILIGGIIACSFLFMLKFTNVGNSNYQIYRLRSAVNPNDPSLIVRLNTQRNLREYMSSRPFGGGLGVIGYNGTEYNSDKYLSTVAPDSYFVKVWAMYGIVGFTIWLSIMSYILGKGCGICWKTEDEALKVKLIALTSGFAGILFCSYGNEVINSPPSSFIVYISLFFIFIGPKLENMDKSTLLS
jgi:O-antigen ligase